MSYDIPISSHTYGVFGYNILEAAANITINAVDYVEYNIDNIVLENTLSGIKITVSQNAPNPDLSYRVKNLNTWIIIGTISDLSTNSFTVTDVNPAVGVNNKYAVEYAFPLNVNYGDSWACIYSGNIYRSIDPGIYDAVKDSSGTVLSEARAAKELADAAHTDAQNAANRTWYNGNESAYWAYSANSKSNDAKNNSATAANRTYYSGKSSARWGYDNYSKIAAVENTVNNLDSEMDVINTKVTNIGNSLSTGDSTPPTLLSIQGYKNATCTTTSKFSVVVDASDPTGPVEFRVRTDTGPWSNWITVGDNYATATGITGSGAHLLHVEIRDGNDNRKALSKTIFKI